MTMISTPTAWGLSRAKYESYVDPSTTLPRTCLLDKRLKVGALGRFWRARRRDHRHLGLTVTSTTKRAGRTRRSVRSTTASAREQKAA
jgi:hypothetical protein